MFIEISSKDLTTFMNKNINDAIKEIVDGIPNGKIFDSHFVIEQLFLNHPDLYLADASNAMNNWHSQISSKIDEMQLLLSIERCCAESWSMDLLHKACPNVAWKKK